MAEDDRSELLRRAERARVRLGQVLHHTDKAIVAAGVRDGVPVVAKLLTSDDPYWIARREHELDIYRRFTSIHHPSGSPA